MIARYLRPLVPAALFIFLSGCTWFINRDKYESEALALFEKAGVYFESADYDKAIGECTSLISAYPRSGFVDDAYYVAGLSFAKKKDWQHAVGAVQKLVKYYPKSGLVPKSRIILAEGYENLKLYTGALTAYIDTYLETPNAGEKTRAETQAKNLLGREQDLNVLGDLYRRYGQTEAAEWLLYHLGKRAYELENFESSERYFAELRTRFPSSPYVGKIGGKDISSSVLKGEFICGLLLPLSGGFSEFGQNVKEGVELAHSLKGTTTISFETYDTRSDPAEAAKGAQNLVKNGAKVIIGPLTSGEVSTAGKVAASYGVPMISPTSTDPALVNLCSCLFQLNSYQEEEVRAIARYALDQGLLQFGVLYPNTEQGKALADVFAATIKSGAGTILYSYPLTDTVEEMKQTFLEIRHKGAQAVFLPFDRQLLLSVVPQIAYYRMKVKMLGLDDFADREILRRADLPFEGVCFAATPGKLANETAINNFYDQYKGKYSKDPDWAATLGFDSYEFIWDALSEGKNLELCQAIRMLDDHRGILGRLVYSNDPEYPAIRIYTIYKGEIKEIK